MKKVLKCTKVYERKKFICVYCMKEVIIKKKKYMFMKVYLYEWYVSRITYTNSDIV